MSLTNLYDESVKNKLSLDLRVVTLVLLVIIVGMLYVWRPWSSTLSDSQTVTVTGETTLADRPDEFTFYPTYQFKNADKTAALNELTKKSDEVVSKLKALGVADKDIKTNSSGYDYQVYYDADSKDTTYTLQVTVKVNSSKLAQEVQDYLVTTTPTGTVSPQAGFSEAKRKQLEHKARDGSTKDAREKADQMAKNLGFKIGKVKSVSDAAGFGAIPILSDSSAATAADRNEALTVQPGENDLSYSVTVIYYVR